MKFALLSSILLILILGVGLVNAQDTICNETQCDASCVKCNDICYDPGFSCIITPVCDETQCDASCVKCSDSTCHDPEFECNEEITIESISPSTVDLGKNQINVLVKNTGNVDLSDIHAEITGDGISMSNYIEIDKLVVNDKDYAFVTLTASKPGNIDLVIKVYVENNMLVKAVGLIKVAGTTEPKPENNYNKTLLEENLNKFKEQYKELESEYQTKKEEGYPVEIVYDNLKETNDYLKDAQIAILSGNLKSADVSLKIAEENLKDIKTELENVKKKEQTFMERIKSNLLYFSSLAAAIITLATAYKLITNHINKDRIKDLHTKLKDTGNVIIPKGKEFLYGRKELLEKKSKKSKKSKKKVEDIKVEHKPEEENKEE